MNAPSHPDHSTGAVKRHLVWLCAGCDDCEPLHGKSVCNGPSQDGAEVVRAEHYDAMLAHVEFLRGSVAKHRASREQSWVERDRLAEALRRIGEMAGAKANGADARAMGKLARDTLASLALDEIHADRKDD